MKPKIDTKVAYIRAQNEHGAVLTFPIEKLCEEYIPGKWVVHLDIKGRAPFIEPLNDYLELEEQIKQDK